VLGLVKQLPSTPPAVIGSACHEGTAAFDKAIIAGEKILPNDTANIVEQYIMYPPEEVDWGSVTKDEATRRALGVYSRYCQDISPKIKYRQVELTLDRLVVDVDGVEIELTGTLDRVYSECDWIDHTSINVATNPTGILDVKTGANACAQKTGKHKAQIGVYELLAENTLGTKVNLPGLVARLQTSYQFNADVEPVTNAQAALLGTDQQTGLIHHIAHLLKTGDWYGNPSSWLCSVKYCPLWDSCIFK